MMKIKILTGLVIWAAMNGAAYAALSLKFVETRDSGNASRASFSTTEKISFAVTVSNSAQSTGRVSFTFAVTDPAGKRVFSQSGNSAPGNAGSIGTDIRNIPISRLYSSPGYYTLTATALLDGQTVTGTARFQVSSPIITLSYPPNGIRDLKDQPLTFRWAGSGATQFKIYVGDHMSLTRNAFIETVMRTSFSYPMNPSNDQHTLAAGEIYYWKVVGLDELGNTVSETAVPFSFSVALSGSQITKDIAVKGITIGKNRMGPGFIPIKVQVMNQGSGPETNISVNLFVNGIEVRKSPFKISRIDAGMTKQAVFPVRVPEESDNVLVTASHDLFDDNISNNRRSRIFTGEEIFPDADEKQITGWTDLSVLWDKTKRAINRPAVTNKFEGYTLYAVQPDSDEAMDALNKFIEGSAVLINVRIKLQR